MKKEQAVQLIEELEYSSAAPLHPNSTTPLLQCHVSTLSLGNFRNYSHARIEVGQNPVVLSGRNGAGKTNILEALSLLTPGRGLRRAKLSEIDSSIPSPRKGEGQDGGYTYYENMENDPHLNPPPFRGRENLCWTVAATVHGLQGEVKIGTGRDPESTDQLDKRVVRVDGKTARSQAELAQHLSVIWLTPQMEQLFNQGTSESRKFLDRLVYSFDPEHASRINEYDYAMRERNRLLADSRADGIWLDALEQTMAETGAAVAQARLSAIDSLNHAISLSKNSFPKAHISATGAVEEMLQNGLAAVDVEDGFKRQLFEARRQDAGAGRTLSGTHRSEMRVYHVEKQMPAEACSTGEQKAMLLSMMLAQIRAAMLWKQVVPMLLLDDAPAHLDSIRKLELFEEICQIGAQVWMTGTDRNFFEELGAQAQYFSIEEGKIF